MMYQLHAQSNSVSGTLPDNASVTQLLEQMYDTDQGHRAKVRDLIQGETPPDPSVLMPLLGQMRQADQQHQQTLQTIIDIHGFPTVAKTSQKAVDGAFFIIQHSSPDLMQQYLPQVRQAANRGDLAKKYLAMLEDRLLVFQGKPQLYGTQPKPSINGSRSNLVWPIANFEQLDQRREAMGLPPFDEYLAASGLTYNPNTKPSLLE